MSRSRGHRNDDKFEFEKDVKIEVDAEIDLEADVDVNVDKYTDIDFNADSDVDLDGNSAELIFDVQAIGDDTLVEGEVVILTADELSSMTGYFASATD